VLGARAPEQGPSAGGGVRFLASPQGVPECLDRGEPRGIPGDRLAYVPEDLEGAYTAGPIAALQAAIRPGRLGQARTTLVLAGGAGITVAPPSTARPLPAEPAARRTLTGRWADAPAARAALHVATRREKAE
jgi:hypothetical protein